MGQERLPPLGIAPWTEPLTLCNRFAIGPRTPREPVQPRRQCFHWLSCLRRGAMTKDTMTAGMPDGVKGSRLLAFIVMPRKSPRVDGAAGQAALAQRLG